MLTKKSIRDIMVDIYQYPHISSDTSLKQAIIIVKNMMRGANDCFQPMVALVFDEKSLVGTLRSRDILKGLEPNFLKPSANMQGHVEDVAELSVIWDSTFDNESRELADRPVSKIMSPIIAFVGPDDPVVKAAYLMIHNDLLILPVVENKKKLVGLVRMIEVFEVLSGSVLERDKRNNVIELKKLM